MYCAILVRALLWLRSGGEGGTLVLSSTERGSHAQKGRFSSFQHWESGSGGPCPGGDGAGGAAEIPGKTATCSGAGAGTARPEGRRGTACPDPRSPADVCASASSGGAACPGRSGSCRGQAAGAAGCPAEAPGSTAGAVLRNRAAHGRGGRRSCLGA